MKRLLFSLLILLVSYRCSETIPTSYNNYVTEKNDTITHVTLTTYNAVKEQCDDTPDITADGTKIVDSKLKDGSQRIVAISQDLLWLIPMGSTVEIEGHGIYVVHDVMNKRYDHCMDILQHKSMKNFKKENIKVRLIENNA